MTAEETTQGNKLKKFMDENFDFYVLRKAGFYPKDMKKSDYKAQAERVCKFFSLASIYEYKTGIFETVSEGVDSIVVKQADYVDNTGNLQQGLGGLLCTIPGTFQCPICECVQDVRENTKLPIYKCKCKGCKRKLSVLVPMFGGKIQVTEV